MQVCYVLTGSNPRFAGMGMLNVTLLRRLHPEARVVVLCDGAAGEMCEPGSDLHRLADEVLVVRDCPAEPKPASRFLKTSMRSRIEGDFLFLDLDALPRCDLSGAAGGDADLALVLDRNQSSRKYVIGGPIRDLYRRLGWTVPERYFNSGVIHFRDSPEARAFGERWHARWRRTHALGVTEDQPSFNSLPGGIDAEVAVLPDRFNVQFAFSPWRLKNSAVVHFFTYGTDSPGGGVMKEMVDGYLRDGELDGGAVDAFLGDGYPWAEEWVKGRIYNGQYGHAVRDVLGKLGGRFGGAAR